MNKRTIILAVFLALLWLVLTGEYTVINFISGLILCYLIIMYSGSYTNIRFRIKMIPGIFLLFIYFLKELVLANLKVAYEIITPSLKMTPGIIKIPLDIDNDLQITLLANLITLTPGTLSLDVTPDKKFIFVHAMYIKDREKFIGEIKSGFEKRIKEIFS